jgi:hypothetical protein
MNGAALSTKRWRNGAEFDQTVGNGAKQRAAARWRDESALRRLADGLVDGAEDRMPAIVPHLDPDPIAEA